MSLAVLSLSASGNRGELVQPTTLKLQGRRVYTQETPDAGGLDITCIYQQKTHHRDRRETTLFPLYPLCTVWFIRFPWKVQRQRLLIL
jgi:hypothetical protein